METINVESGLLHSLSNWFQSKTGRIVKIILIVIGIIIFLFAFEFLEDSRYIYSSEAYLLGILLRAFYRFLYLTFCFWLPLWFLLKFVLPRIIRREGESILTSTGEVETTVKKIFNSDSFLTILRTSLPKGKTDANYGFDFIPYMLHTIDERKKLFTKISNRFLTLTVILGISFSIILVYFAYILVNEAAIGTPRTLIQIEENTKALSEQLQFISLNKGQPYQKVFDETLKPILETDFPAINPDNKSVDNVSNDKNIAPHLEEIRQAILATQSSGKKEDVEYLGRKLNETRAEISKNLVVSQSYRQSIQKAAEEINYFLNSVDTARWALPNSVIQLDNLIKQANENFQKSENRIAEVLKRFSLGLILATFFLAILRYLGGLYKDNYKQVLAAENDALTIRKFYVAYKASQDSSSSRDNTIAAFMGKLEVKDSKDAKDSTDSINSDNNEIIKELMTLLAKKL